VFHDYGVFPRPADTSPNRLISVGQTVRDITTDLSAAGVASPLFDAQELAAFVLGVPRSRLATVSGFTKDELNRLSSLAARRAARIPLQHLLGTAPFRHLELAVGPGVFVPRPETELLVDWGLAALRAAGRPEPIVVDLCSGSGAIALSIAREHPGARVYAVERDPAALDWLRRNINWLRRNTKTNAGGVSVVAGDATDPAVLADLDGRVDLVLCNPPYVPDGTPVPPEVADHDPAPAVFGGPDGLAVIRGVIARAAALLRRTPQPTGLPHRAGSLAIEHDDTHAEAAPALLRAAGAFERIEGHRDLAGRPRFVTGYRLAD
jgi:release factor glutamine methyltransferase